ncbi:N-acetyltransferase [Alkalibacillus sp. S2W]|uniref:N-acetyltransferase n=1 Tax=Alkalibacillus TaxID=331654 RepID=UPI00142212BF|nr:N-acetyltransferase [Alkalibacillus almallahensis]NIK10687.1 GNAT superfamily N-acetyltransferase [Alkalibacillus almallahensis]
MPTKVEPLLINFRTLEEFKKFKAYGIQELSMLEDLENNMIENNSESPFYGIYYGDELVARMSLYRVDAKYDYYFEPQQDFLQLWKLEVLNSFRNRGFGKQLVDFAKSFNLPIKTNARINSHGFWEKQGFQPATYELQRDFGENPFIWLPEGVSEKGSE